MIFGTPPFPGVSPQDSPVAELSWFFNCTPGSDVSSPDWTCALRVVNHPRQEQSRHKVFPVPVGDSSKPLTPLKSKY